MKRWFILEGFYTSDSRGSSNRQPYKGLHVFLTCQHGKDQTGLTSARCSHAQGQEWEHVVVVVPHPYLG
jgi:hypothetical protein